MASKRVAFGYCLPVFASPGVISFRTPSYERLDAQRTMSLARLADDLGYDSLWVADHLFLGRDGEILEGWTTLAALAGATSRAKLGTIHLCNGFREPSLVAKMSATLDQISGGRLVLFYDAGWRQAEFDAYGFPFPEAAVRVERCREGLEIIRRLWSSEQPVTYTGRYYSVRSAICRPGPQQRPRPPIWIGETREGLADLAADLADGWNSVPASVDVFRAKLAEVEAACARRGRDFEQLDLSLETQILIAPTQADLRRLVDRIDELRGQVGEAAADRPIPDPHQELEERRKSWLVGTPDDVVDQLRAFIGLGVSHFLMWFLDAPDEQGLRLFAERVAPVFRGE